MPKNTHNKALISSELAKPLKFQPDHIEIDLQIHDIDNVDVTTVYHYKDVHPSETASAVIELDFEDLKLSVEDKKQGKPTKSLLSLELDGMPLIQGRDFTYLGAQNKIHLTAPKDNLASFTLTARTNISAKDNTTGVGLYMSDGNIFFKGETMNFRKIAPVQDRTDVLSTFDVTIAINDQAENLKSYTQMLSNGDKTDEGRQDNGYLFARYQDNVPKPCYLMGVQAGEFVTEGYSHTFSNGHKVKIYTHVPPKDMGKDKLVYEGIVKAMEYFDREFGLIYDKPEYHLVSLTNFNAGATETKGMPMFSASYFTTDKDYVPYSNLLATKAVVGHEYIHEFIGNRFYITNWLELATKEGQTVFMENLFSAAMLADNDVVRITQTNGMINGQFAKEDDQDLPPIPDALDSERDHYTGTTYSKGAECFGMIHSIMGHDTYTMLVKEFVDKHEAQNGGIDAFLKLAETHHNYDFTGKFARWFKQSGRAAVHVNGKYDADAQSYTLQLEQRFKGTNKQPLPIPLDLALCGKDGKMNHQQLYIFDQERATVTIDNVTSEPVAYSINRGFSAPVEIHHDQDASAAIALLAAESDGVTQWLIAQDIHRQEIIARYEALSNNSTPPRISNALSDALKTLIKREDIAPDVLAKLLTPPPCGGLRSQMDKPNAHSLQQARDSYAQEMAEALYSEMAEKYTKLRSQIAAPYQDNKADHQKRTLAATLLSFSVRLNTQAEFDKVNELANNADNGQDRLNAMSVLPMLAAHDLAQADKLKADFISFMARDTNGLQKSLELFAAQSADDPKMHLHEILNNPAYQFNWDIPHHISQVAVHFAANFKNFHHPSGNGYEALADMAIEAGKRNPEAAAKVGMPLVSLNNFDDETASKMYKALKKIDAASGMPRQLREQVSAAIEKYDDGQNNTGSAQKPNCQP